MKTNSRWRITRWAGALFAGGFLLQGGACGPELSSALATMLVRDVVFFTLDNTFVELFT